MSRAQLTLVQDHAVLVEGRDVGDALVDHADVALARDDHPGLNQVPQRRVACFGLPGNCGGPPSAPAPAAAPLAGTPLCDRCAAPARSALTDGQGTIASLAQRHQE